MKKRKSSVLKIPENGDDEEVAIEVEEGQEVVLKSPRAISTSGLIQTTPADESAIQDILDRGSDVDDDEIEEATKRLLACTLLQGDIDDIWDNSDGEHVHDDGDDVEQPGDQEEHAGEDGDGGEDAFGDEAADLNVSVGYGTNDTAPRQQSDSDDDPPNEMTSLLGRDAGSGSSMASHNEELLRPSIFTTVSNIDTQRRMDFN